MRSVVVVGAGQAGLAVGAALRRRGVEPLLLVVAAGPARPVPQRMAG